MGWILTVLIAAACGGVAARIVGAKPLGCLTSIAVGFVGALIGRFLSQKLAVPDLIYLAGVPVAWTVLGATLFVAVALGFSGSSRKR